MSLQRELKGISESAGQVAQVHLLLKLKEDNWLMLSDDIINCGEEVMSQDPLVLTKD